MVVKLDNIEACVFDAYGTLFDITSAARECGTKLDGKWEQLARVWREKQLQYSWLRSLMDEYVPFWQITGDALDYAMAAVDVDDAELRSELLDVYMKLGDYPEVSGVLKTLKDNGFRTATLSNGSPDMLNAAVTNAKLDSLLDGVISVDEVGVFKPDGRIYQLAVDQLETKPGSIAFMSSNAWDAWAASNFGFKVVWCNRFGQPEERLPGQPDAQITSLSELPPILGL